MAIRYYPSRPQRAKQPVADRWMAKPTSLLSQGNQDLNSGALDTTLSYPADWKVNSIDLQFSDSTEKVYTVSKQNGRKVVENENDYLWFIADGFFPTKITLDEGFYTGDELAAHLKTKLDAAFTGVTFTVDYHTTNANKFTIVPDSGTIKYIDINLQARFNYKQSIAGHLFGFEETSASLASLASDTEVPALNLNVELFTDSNSALSVTNDDGYIMDIDQGLRLEIEIDESDSSSGTFEVDWTINYEERV